MCCHIWFKIRFWLRFFPWHVLPSGCWLTDVRRPFLVLCQPQEVASPSRSPGSPRAGWFFLVVLSQTSVIPSLTCSCQALPGDSGGSPAEVSALPRQPAPCQENALNALATGFPESSLWLRGAGSTWVAFLSAVVWKLSPGRMGRQPLTSLPSSQRSPKTQWNFEPSYIERTD